MSEPYVHEVRAGYGDTDQSGVIHHAVYLRWLEDARVAWLRDRGASFAELEERRLGLAVARADVRYRRPAFFDDLLAIECRLERARAATVVFDYRVLRGDELLLEATVTLACISLDTLRPVRVPKDLFA